MGMGVGEEEMDISERIAEEVQRAVKAAEAKVEANIHTDTLTQIILFRLRIVCRPRKRWNPCVAN